MPKTFSLIYIIIYIWSSLLTPYAFLFFAWKKFSTLKTLMLKQLWSRCEKSLENTHWLWLNMINCPLNYQDYHLDSRKLTTKEIFENKYRDTYGIHTKVCNFFLLFWLTFYYLGGIWAWKFCCHLRFILVDTFGRYIVPNLPQMDGLPL